MQGGKAQCLRILYVNQRIKVCSLSQSCPANIALQPVNLPVGAHTAVPAYFRLLLAHLIDPFSPNMEDRRSQSSTARTHGLYLCQKSTITPARNVPSANPCMAYANVGVAIG